MKKTLFTLAFLTTLMVAAQSTWKSDGAHSKVGFAITHLMISEVEGHFSEFDITATATDTFDDAEKIEKLLLNKNVVRDTKK